MILTKTILCLILGFLSSLVLGFLIVPFFKKCHMYQSISKTISKRHLLKEGTPTMGGVIFIISTLFIIIFLFLNKNIHFNLNLFIILCVFILYALLGFIDDFLKIRFHNNKGLSIILKFFIQVIIGIFFFVLFLISGNNTVLNFYLFSIDLKYLYGLLILFMLVGSSNAVNITDGLDGLAAGLCTISFISYGIIAFNSPFILGYEEIGIFCFTLAGALVGFLFFNFYPAKIFMGDLGSLSLGATLASVSILLKCELSLVIIGLVFIIETLSSFIQIISIRYFNKKIFLKSPLHHHFEMLGFKETDIIKLFYLVSLVCSLITLIYILVH